jgi:hypothetical protein
MKIEIGFEENPAERLSGLLLGPLIPWEKHRISKDPSSMLSDRRSHRRYKINRIAKFQQDAYTLPRDCMISDLSDRGARLFAEGVDIPEQFHLLISDDDRGLRRQCKVVWRLGYELGVQFTDPIPAGWRI